MPADESTRLRIRQYLIELMDEKAADAMMESMPPIPWTELATKSDIARVDGSLLEVRERLGSVEGRIDTLTLTTQQNSRDIQALAAAVSAQGVSLGSRIDSMSDRMDTMSGRMDTMSERIDGLGNRMDDVGRAIAVGALTMAVMLALFIAGTVASLIGAGAFG